MTPILIAPPAVEPLSLAEAKVWLRVDTTSDDDVIGALIASARLVVEALVRRVLVAQTWRIALDSAPASGFLLPISPVRSIAAVRVFPLAGPAQTLPADMYALDQDLGTGRLVFNMTPPSPGRLRDGFEIDFVAGFSDTAAGVPAPLRQAMRILIARWYENRGDVEADADMARTPASVAALVAPYRRVRLA
jgi:uncharacterized phiE125 gp8 family phage protein